MPERISGFYDGSVSTFRAQVRTENPRSNEGHLRSGLPFSTDPLPPCVDGPYHPFRSHAASVGSKRGVNICPVCGLGSIYDSA